ncbi:MAG: hypothetical protein ACLT98_17430 [Eggerthellaceae bacterium]
MGAINSRYQLAAFGSFRFEIDKMEAMEDIVRYANGFVNYDLSSCGPTNRARRSTGSPIS